jgi:hypothetical protein
MSNPLGLSQILGNEGVRQVENGFWCNLGQRPRTRALPLLDEKRVFQ